MYYPALKTNRSLLKMALLGFITFGIYNVVILSQMSEEINQVATRHDGRKTMHYCLIFFLLGPITGGIANFIWFHRFSRRIGQELQARRIYYAFGADTYWLWNVLGSLILVGPFIYTHRLCTAMNYLNANYNAIG